MKIIIYLLLILLLAFCVNLQEVFGQGYEDDFYESFMKTDIAPVSNAASLGQYVETPVSLYTGVPGISIPLYTVQTGDYSLPIFISYHSSGIKVAQSSSWIGLGWALNAGGVITRTVKSLPDDLDETYYNENWISNSGFLYAGETIKEVFNTNHFNSYDDEKFAQGNIDGEPDIFYFNFNGHTGKFMFDCDKNINFIGEENYLIEFEQKDAAGNIDAHGFITEFTITTDDGVKYIFDKYEHTLMMPCLESDIFDLSTLEEGPLNFFPLNVSGMYDKTYNSSWFLTKIITTTGQEINFNYDPEPFYKMGFPSVSKKISSTRWAKSLFEIQGHRLTEIIWNNGKIKFIATNEREDVIRKWNLSDGSVISKKALSDVLIYNKVATNPIKSFKLNTSYFISDGIDEISDPNKFAYKRLKLDNIQEFVFGTTKTLPPTQFFYNETLLPNKFSFEQDFWGYYNSNNADDAAYTDMLQGINFIPKIYEYKNYEVTNTSFYNSIYSIYIRPGDDSYIEITGENREPETTVNQACILNKIDYPTGGSKKLTYESNRFLLDGEEKIGGGIRIKEIISTDSESEVLKKTFTYTEDDGITSGRIFGLPLFASFYPWACNSIPAEGLPDEEKAEYCVKRYSTSVGELGTTKGSHVGYRKVTENNSAEGKIIYEYAIPAEFGTTTADLITTSMNNNTSGDISVGEYVYSRPNTLIKNGPVDFEIKCPFPFPSNPNYDWNRGQLLKKTIVNKDGFKVKEIENIFNIYSFRKIPSIKVKRYYISINPNLKYSIYYSLCGTKNLSQRVVTDYYNSETQAVATSTNYLYNNYGQINEISTFQSDGSEIIESYKYPLDYSPDFTVFPTDEYLKGIWHLALNHIIKPIEVYTTKSDAGVISGKINIYKNFQTIDSYDLIEPWEIYTLETSTPLADYAPTFIDAAFHMDNRYKLNMTYDNYDTYGNLLQYHKENDIPTSFIWGYNNSLPIAKVVNAESDKIFFNGFEDKSGWSNNTYDENFSHSGSISGKIVKTTSGERTSFCNQKIDLTLSESTIFKFSGWVYSDGPSADIYLFWRPDRSDELYNGASCTHIRTTVTGKWTYIEKEVSIPSNTQRMYVRIDNNGGGTVWFDDIRVHPADAHMTTYTYDPLIGMTSVTNENNVTTYYEYDDFGRLKQIKDDDGNILERNEYNYKEDYIIKVPQDLFRVDHNAGTTVIPVFINTSLENLSVQVNPDVPWLNTDYYYVSEAEILINAARSLNKTGEIRNAVIIVSGTLNGESHSKNILLNQSAEDM